MSGGPAVAGRPVVAFYAPMKAPSHPTPSGDRAIARLTLAALERAGFAPRTVSELRLLDMTGDPARQTCLASAARAEAGRIEAALRADPPALWFTYHCHYKAPDLIGPTVSRALAIPYAISEASVSPRRRAGAWACFARASEAAIAAADGVFWTTARDLPGLEAGGHGGRAVHLPAFVDPGPPPHPREAHSPPRLLTIAMMRPGDKLESYRRLAASLAHLDAEWVLQVVGDGAARPEVEALFRPLGRRVSFRGRVDDPRLLRAACEEADIFVWPGVGEGVGMVYLEAQAAGLPVVAEDHPAQRELVAGPLVAPDSPGELAAAVAAALAARCARGVEARAHVEAHHSLDSAARTLGASLRELIR